VQCSIRFSLLLMEVYKIAVTFSSAFTPSPEQLRKTVLLLGGFDITHGLRRCWNAASRPDVRGVGAIPCWTLLRTSWLKIIRRWFEIGFSFIIPGDSALLAVSPMPDGAGVTFQRERHCLMFCWTCIVVYQYSKTNHMNLLNSVYFELTASTCFEHYLLISGGAAGLEWNSNPGSSQQT
jgi:hypothetical protein